jgi:putative hydrolase of the HAD superfamily
MSFVPPAGSWARWSWSRDIPLGVIAAVLFDGDQTLWDLHKVMAVALAAVLDELRLARPGARADALTVADLQSDRAEVARECAGIEFNMGRLRTLGFARVLQRLRDEGAPGDESDEHALAARLSSSYLAHRDRDPALFADTLPCLAALRTDYRLGLVSNGSRSPDVVGLAGYFKAVVFSQDHNVAKPDRGIFAIVEQLLGIPPDSAVLVGDHPLNDVVGAKRSGWRAVWLDRTGDGTYRAPEGCREEPDAVVTSLTQLPDVLRAL